MTGSTILKGIVKQKYFAIATVGFVLWLAETAYFGFNATPENNVEKTLDFVSALLIGWGIIGDILKGVEIHKKSTTVFNETHNITTKKVEVIGDNQKVNYNFGTTKEETQRLLSLGRGDKKDNAKS